MKYKIGQVIKFSKEFTINVEPKGTALVKKGDTARVVRKVDDTVGEIVYLSGEAKGKSQRIKIEVDDDINSDEIAKRIMQELGK